MHDVVGEIAVVCEEKQARRVLVESADGKDALFYVDEFHNGFLEFVGERGNVACWLVEHNGEFFWRLQFLAFNDDFCVVWRGFADCDDSAVDRDSARYNQLFGEEFLPPAL